MNVKNKHGSNFTIKKAEGESVLQAYKNQIVIITEVIQNAFYFS